MVLGRPFKIHESVIISNLDKLVDLINKNDFDFFKITHNGSRHIKFESKSSVGIGSINNLVFEPIAINAILVVEESEKRLILYNNLRIDAIIITLVATVLILILFYQQFVLGKNIPFWINCILLPIVVLFFNWLYYVQEKNLQSHIKSVLVAESCIG